MQRDLWIGSATAEGVADDDAVGNWWDKGGAGDSYEWRLKGDFIDRAEVFILP